MSNYSDSSFHENNSNTSWYKVFNLVPSKALVLDVGCSSGNFGQELINRKKCVVDGIEIDSADYEEAKKKLRSVYRLDVERDNLDELTEKYDIIYFGDVIEHLVNPVIALKKIKTFLKPKGKILFSIPNMTHIAIRLLLLKGDLEYTETGLLDKTHLHFYGLDEVYKVFSEAGYAIDHMDFVKQGYPDEVVADWLEGLGLSGNKTFYESLKQPEASAFQFVGTAIIADKETKIKRQQFGPIDFVDKYHLKKVRALETKVRKLENKYTEVSREYHNLSIDYAKLVEDRKSLKKNPIAYTAKKIKSKVIKKIRN